MNDTKKFPDSAEARERRRQKAAWGIAQQESNSAVDGRLAWDAIKQWRREKQERLEVNNRIAIAQNLWVELDHYKNSTLTDLFNYAGLPPNIKDKVTLQRGKTSDGKKLKAEVTPYLKLIEALAQKTCEDLYLLADRVLLGTTFHPVSHTKLQEAQLIMDALQVAVERIDRKFNLWEQCMTIVELRKPREERYVEAVIHDEQEVAWAEFQFDPDANDMLHMAGVPVEKWWPLEKFLLIDRHTEKADGEERLVETPIKPFNPFWLKQYRYHDSFSAGVWSGESILFFPHVYLGPAIEWGGSKPEKYMEDDRWVDINTDPEPYVRFDDGSQEYLVYLRDPKTDREHHGGTEFDWDMSYGMSGAARWLIIYPDPDPDAKRLIPALFSRGNFASTELLPLDARLIAEFGDKNRWQYVGRDGAPTLLQRLKDLTGYVTGDFKVMDAWRETAERFYLNPIFRSSHPSEAEKILYQRRLERWIADGV